MNEIFHGKDNNKETMQMGAMMAMDAENRPLSGIPVRLPKAGTKTIPPPAPNNPFTIPAAPPEMDKKTISKQITSDGDFYRQR